MSALALYDSIGCLTKEMSSVLIFTVRWNLYEQTLIDCFDGNWLHLESEQQQDRIMQ